MTTFDLHSFQILLKVLFPCISVDYYDIDTKAFLLKSHTLQKEINKSDPLGYGLHKTSEGTW